VCLAVFPCDDIVDCASSHCARAQGKRTGVYGAYLLACYNEDTEDFECICKIGTGFSDQQV